MARRRFGNEKVLRDKATSGLALEGCPEMAAPSGALFVPPAGGYGMGTACLACVKENPLLLRVFPRGSSIMRSRKSRWL